MLKFILNTLVMLSLGGIIYLVLQTLPRVSDEESNAGILKPHWITIYLEKIDVWLKARFERMLRRLKIWILKLDNWVSDKLNKFKKAEPKETIAALGEEEKSKEPQ